MTKTLYSTDHEYIRIEGDIGTVGITHYAQNALGDVVYVELPKLGIHVEKGGQVGVVESVKSASEVYCPVSGEILEINEELSSNPALVNQDPEKDAWFFKLRLHDLGQLDGLMDETAYKKLTGQ
jgi:glycine cleavage system H protein